MAVNKVVLENTTLIDLTGDTVTAADVMPGKTFHLASGAQATGAWSPREVTAPSVSVGTYTYNGSAQGPTIGSYDSDEVTVTGATATNAGTYTLTVALKYPGITQWSDGTMDAKTYSYTIAKATGTVTVSSDSVTLNASNLSVDVTIGGAGENDWTAASSDTSLATVSKSGSTLTITSSDELKGNATVTVSRAESANYTAASATISVTCTFASVYGVYWDGTSSPVWSRTDKAQNFTDPVPAVNNGNGSSPFDNILPWSGMRRVEDSAAGTLVEIPKFWYKWTKSGVTMKLQIADGPAEGFSVSPAHMDRGDGTGERDYVYVGAYHCSSSNYKSATGVKPKASITRATARSSIHNLGSNIWQWDFAMWWTINMLYLVEYANWNSQAKIGYGCGNNSSTENSGLCDAMTYHTGTNASSRTTYGHVRYRWIEDLWANVLDWVDGIYFSSSNIYCIKNPASFSDSSGGTKTGTRPTSSNCIKAWAIPSASGFGWALYPSEVVSDSNYATYSCDRCYYGSSGVVLSAGGGYYQYQSCGAFFLDGDNSASSTVSVIGSRLQKLP